MPTRIVALTDDAFVILEEALKRASLTMGIPKTTRPIAYDRMTRNLVVEDPRYDRDEGGDVVQEAQEMVAAAEAPPMTAAEVLAWQELASVVTPEARAIYSPDQPTAPEMEPNQVTTARVHGPVD